MAKEEILLRLSILEGEAKKLQEQLQTVNQQIADYEALKLSLEKLDGSDNDVLAPLGRGIFFKAKKIDNEFLVNIGNNLVVKKTGKDAAEIINKQINKMAELKTAIENHLEELTRQMQNIVEEARKEKD